MTEYQCITADPPWLERGGGKIKRGADRHYDLMKTTDIARLMLDAPCWRPAESCHLWLWVTDNFLLDGLSLMERLGFRYVRQFHWIKTLAFLAEEDERSIAELDETELQQGLGQYARGSSETCLFGVRGKALVPPPDMRPKNVIFAPRTKHSAKPAKAYEYWFDRVSHGPRLEMFARNARPGWDRFGLEAPAP